MDGRRGFGWGSYGGHGGPPLSPFASELGPGGQPPSIRDEDFSYITSSDLETPGFDNGYYSPTEPRASGVRIAPPAPLDPSLDIPVDDLIVITHQGRHFEEFFPAYSIGDGKLLVGDIRDRVQLVMQLSDRRTDRLRLFYKGRQLKEDNKPACHYGVKNKSEVMVVMPDEQAPPDENGSETSEEIVVVENREDEPEGGRRKPKGGKKRPKKQQQQPSSPRDSNSGVGLTVPDEDRKPGSRGHSPARSNVSVGGSGSGSTVVTGGGVGGGGASVVSAASAASGASAARPGTPMAALETISANFRDTLLPLCEQFVAKPPADPKKRDEEHRRITETVLQKVILKLDAVEHNGDEAIKIKRKELIKEAQDWLNRMDGRK